MPYALHTSGILTLPSPPLDFSSVTTAHVRTMAEAMTNGSAPDFRFFKLMRLGWLTRILLALGLNLRVERHEYSGVAVRPLEHLVVCRLQLFEDLVNGDDDARFRQFRQLSRASQPPRERRAAPPRGRTQAAAA